jgi:dnd system-associated protein 4
MIDDRRLRPPERYEKALEAITSSHPFDTKQAAMMFAAGLGCYLHKRESLGKGGEGVRWQVFERSQDAAFLYALGLEETKAITVLSGEREEELVAIFEEYVAAGLQHIQENFLDRPGDILDYILLLLADARLADRGAVPGLEGLSTADLSLLGGLGS